MPQRGRKRKKARTQNANAPEEANTALATAEKIPKSLVFRKGKTVSELAELVADLRKLMQPYTAIHFQEDARNRKLTLQQYATNLALPMGMTHLLQISQPTDNCVLKIARLPAGPVLHFRINQFTLNRHIRSKQKRPIAWTQSLTSNSPVVVTHQFDATPAEKEQGQQQQQQPHIKLLHVTFQNMFPTLNVSQVSLNSCRRVVMFHRHVDEKDDDDGATVRVTMRHYAITTRATHIPSTLRRLARRRRLPNLHNVADIADYVEHTNNSYHSDGMMSDTDDEEETTTVVTGASSSSSQRSSEQQRSLKLVELGPRLDLALVGVTKGLSTSDDWLWHAHKSSATLAQQAAQRQAQREAVQARREQQEANVRAKREKREKRKKKRDNDEERIEGVSSSSEDESEQQVE